MARKKPPVENLELVTPAADEKPVATVTMAALTEGESLPEVNTHAIEAVQAESEEIKQIEASEPVRLKKDGTPAKKRGRKAGATIHGRHGFAIPDSAQATISSEAAAVTVSGVLEQMQVVLISKEFAYKDVERLNNVNAWRKTFDYYGGVNLSPPAELALSHASIILSRAMAGGETKTKLALGAAWVKNKIAGLKNALSNRGKNVKRQDDIREEESASPQS